MLFLLYFFSYFFLYFSLVIVWLVFGFIFTFLLGRRPGFFALGSCGKPQRGRKATAPLHTPRAFF